MSDLAAEASHDREVPPQIVFAGHTPSCSSSRDGAKASAVQNSLGCFGFLSENRPRRNLVVPLDESRNRTRPCDDTLIEGRDGVGHRHIMRVDEKRRPGLVHGGRMAAKMDFANLLEWKR